MKDETKRKISEALKGRIFSIETRYKISQARMGKGFSHVAESKEKMSKWHKENPRGKLFQFQTGRIINPQGYVRIYVPNAKKRIFEHRLVMEKKIGRLLEKNELVHHINGIKDDNRPENLEVMLRKTHCGKVKCPHCQKEFFIK